MGIKGSITSGGFSSIGGGSSNIGGGSGDIHQEAWEEISQDGWKDDGWDGIRREPSTV